MTNGYFETTDLGLGAYLLARGHELRAVRAVTERQRMFVFGIDAEGDAESFYRNASIPARAYAAALRDIKSLLHQSHIPNAEESRDQRNPSPAGV